MPATTNTAAGVGFEELTVGGTSVGFTSVPNTASDVILSVEGDAIRFKLDGTDPTASEGVRLPDGFVGAFTDFSQYALTQFRFIATTGSATVSITFVET